MIGDDFILSEAIRLVGEGVSVTFPVKGRSMLPFIVGDRDSVILESSVAPRWGDVVLAEVEGDRYVVHRIVKIENERVTLMGDGNLVGREHCRLDQIRAKASYVVRPDGKRCSLDCFRSRLLAKVWYGLLPLRRWLLAIYRRIA